MSELFNGWPWWATFIVILVVVGCVYEIARAAQTSDMDKHAAEELRKVGYRRDDDA